MAKKTVKPNPFAKKDQKKTNKKMPMPAKKMPMASTKMPMKPCK